jgi:hypothetical protein
MLLLGIVRSGPAGAPRLAVAPRAGRDCALVFLSPAGAAFAAGFAGSDFFVAVASCRGSFETDGSGGGFLDAGAA